MEALKIKGVAHKGILSVTVPTEFNEKELDVTIFPVPKKTNDLEQKAHEEKVKRLLSIVGTAKYPNFPINKYDAYDQ